MEGIHGVDTSWLHHSKFPGLRPPTGAPVAASSPPSSVHSESKSLENPSAAGPEEKQKENGEGRKSSTGGGSDATSDLVNGGGHASDSKQAATAHHVHLPFSSTHTAVKNADSASLNPSTHMTPPTAGTVHLPPAAAAAAATNPKSARSPSPGLRGRSSSWISSLSSKFSPSKGHDQKDHAKQAQHQNAAAAKPTTSPKMEKTDPMSVVGNAKLDTQTGTTPPRPGNFLSSALRRFSSASGTSVGKTVPNGGICPRRVLNVDPYRDRCDITDLQPAKLRRVAFCVDVEIAATPKYRDESPEDPTITLQQRKRSNSSSSEKKSKAKNKERSEGEALKNPDAMVEQKEKEKPKVKKPRSSSNDMFEIPDSDDEPPATESPAKKPASPSKVAQTAQTAKTRQPRVTSPMVSPMHGNFGPSAMFEVDDFDDFSEKLKVPGQPSTSRHRDFGKNGMFEIPSASSDEDAVPKKTGAKPERRRSSAGSSSSADKPAAVRNMALQMGSKPPGHVFTEHLMFEIPDNEGDDEPAAADAAVQVKDPSEEKVSETSKQNHDAPAVNGNNNNNKADKVDGQKGETEEKEGQEKDNMSADAPVKKDQAETPPLTRKKEKKKKSEQERKERKEKKRQAAIANGTIPVELTSEEASGASSGGPQPSNKPKTQNRPTTDPLRIYRRCCSLRETTPLPRVVDQLSSPACCDPLNPAVVLSLDLSHETISMQDLVTLGDWLGVVPVQKLILENCGLTDEGVRIVLSGLLAVKTSDQARHNKHLLKKQAEKTKVKAHNGKKERLGVVNKLSLKDNRLIGRQGWMHIGYFINMSRSLKAIDLSVIPFPRRPPQTSPPSPEITLASPTGTETQAAVSRQGSTKSEESLLPDPFDLFAKCIAERQGGEVLEEVVMGECDLSGDRVEKLIDAVIACRCSRFGLANNGLDKQGLRAVGKYLMSGNCIGLDLGGNDLSSQENQKIILEALDSRENKMYALSLAHTNISPSHLKVILPILARLPEFRFIDLSHNQKLFDETPDALSSLRRYLPRMPNLKRFHLNNVAMRSEHAIALAEVCPDIPSLAHMSILENPALTALANAKDEEAQEEACALYASLMAATRVSRTIVCIDIDVPSKENSEVVKSLAKQVVAYSLRNMERGEAYKSAAALISDPHGGEKAVTVPDVLLHLVGHVDNVDHLDPNHDEDKPAPDQDYLVGGTGVVKALSVVLGNRSNRDSRRLSRDATPAQSGTTTPRLGDESAYSKGKARDMSKNLLESARKIRHRLQPALVRARADAAGDLTAEENYRRLFHLDQTLERVIQRFEDEYPECRPPRPLSVRGNLPGSPLGASSDAASFAPNSLRKSLAAAAAMEAAGGGNNIIDDEDEPAINSDEEGSIKGSSLLRSRHGSDVSLASRNLMNEEGRIHKFGQRVRREILPPVHTLDHHWGTSGDGQEPLHLNELRSRLENMDGEQIKREVEAKGVDQALKDMNATVQALKAIEREGGGVWEKCRMAGMYSEAEAKPKAEPNEGKGESKAELKDGEEKGGQAKEKKKEKKEEGASQDQEEGEQEDSGLEMSV